MTPFSANPPTHPELSLSQRLFGRAPVIVFIALLIPGLAAVGWRAAKRGAERKTQARAQAALAGLALERELSHAVTAAEALGAAASQPGASASTFESVAAQLLITRPALSSLEWSPGGVVTSIVPRAGNERSIGKNMLRDPWLAPAANEAIRRRAMLVIGPIPLSRGEAGFSSYRPVFVRGRDGRESFWGFVSASLRQNDLLNRAQLDQLALRGYEYHLFKPPYGSRKAVTLIDKEGVPIDAQVQQRIRAHNLEMILAIQPKDGWYGFSRAALQAAAVVVAAGLLALLVALKEERSDFRVALDEMDRKLSRESSEKSQAQEDCKAVKNQTLGLQADLARTSAALQADENALVELRKELESLAAVEESSRRELQKILEQHSVLQEEIEKQANANQTEISTIRLQLSQAQAELKKRANETEQLRGQLEAERKESSNALETSIQERAREQTLAGEWQGKFEDLQRTARKNEKDLGNRVAAAEKQVVELSTALEVSKQALEALKSAAQPIETPKPEPAVEAKGPEQPAPEAVSVPASVSEPELEPAESALGEEAVQPPPVEEEVILAQPVTEPELAVPEVEDPGTPVEPATPVEEPASSSLPETKPEPVIEEHSAPVAAEATASEAAEPVSKAPIDKPARKRKAKRDQQIDLFLGAPPAEPTASNKPEPQVDASSAVPAVSVEEPAKEAEAQTPVPTIPGPTEDRDYTEVFSEPHATEEPPGSNPESTEEEEVAEEPVETTFPTVPGLMVSEGLSLSDGDSDKYLKALQHFAEHQRKATGKIRDHMVQGDMPSAERVLNSLKVAAGEIGAMALRESAGKLDQAMHGESDPAEVEFQWLEVDKSLRDLLTGLKPMLEAAAEPPGSKKPSEHRAKVDVSQLRKAVNQILPLLTDNDPGAKDCFKDYRSVFRPAFTPEAYEEFEQAMKRNDFGPGLDLLKKAVKKHGIT